MESTLPNTISPESHPGTTTQIPPTEPPRPSDAVLARSHHHRIAATPEAVTYRECLKNHAAPLGGYAVDGCGEFMPSPLADAADPTSLKCAACGCHRNFHLRDPEQTGLRREPRSNLTFISAPNSVSHWRGSLPTSTHAVEYQPQHRHHPPPPPSLHRNSASPPPLSSYYPSVPHMLLSLSGGASAPQGPSPPTVTPSRGSRKRFRTKFSQNQKEKMLRFAERVGWKLQKRDAGMVREFCNEIGVEKKVLKVWMHNNKNTYGKKLGSSGNGDDDHLLEDRGNHNGSSSNEEDNNGGKNGNRSQNDSDGEEGTKGSSSS